MVYDKRSKPSHLLTKISAIFTDQFSYELKNINRYWTDNSKYLQIYSFRAVSTCKRLNSKVHKKKKLIKQKCYDN